jgi:hypothetical protein
MHGIESKANGRALSEEKRIPLNALIVRRDDSNNHTEDEDYHKLLIPAKSDKDYSIISGKSPLKKCKK